MKLMTLMGTTVLAFAMAAAPMLAQMTAVGDGEGALNIVAWPGYVERGESDPAYDWVTKYEKATGCMVNVKTAATSDEMVTLMNHVEEGISFLVSCQFRCPSRREDVGHRD